MSHSEEHHEHEHKADHHGHEAGGSHSAHGNKKAKKTLLKVLIIVGSIIVGFIALLLVGVIVMFINYINIPSTSIDQAIAEATQAVGGWFQPVVDLYNRVTGAATQVQQAVGN